MTKAVHISLFCPVRLTLTAHSHFNLLCANVCVFVCVCVCVHAHARAGVPDCVCVLVCVRARPCAGVGVNPEGQVVLAPYERLLHAVRDNNALGSSNPLALALTPN